MLTRRCRRPCSSTVGFIGLTVVGYTPGEGVEDGSTIIIGGRHITEVYVCDPASGAGKDHAMAVQTWLNEYLTFPVQCGEFEKKYAVIASG